MAGDENQPIAPAPRAVTPRVRRRVSADPRVRVVWLMALVLAAIALWFIAAGIYLGVHDVWLIRHGVRIEAKVAAANGETVKGRPQPPDSSVLLEFAWQGKADYQPPWHALEGRREPIVTGSILPIHVNPNNPNDWTWRDEPMPLTTRIIGGIYILPVALLAGCWAMFRYAKMMRLWREGIVCKVLIVDTRLTAVAPLCRTARATPDEEGDNRIYTFFLPGRSSNLGRGDVARILRSPGRSTAAIAAEWFQ